MSNNQDYIIDSKEKLEALINSDGLLNQDARIQGSFKSLGILKKVNGHLSIDSEYLQSLGDLTNVTKDIWYHEKSLKSLGNLKEVGGSMNMRYSDIECLGELVSVKGDLSLRDTNISNLGKLQHVGGNLFLPKRMQDIDISHIEILGKLKYWNDKMVKKKLFSVGSEHIDYVINNHIPENFSSISRFKHINQSVNLISNNENEIIIYASVLRKIKGIKQVNKNLNLNESEIQSMGDLRTVLGNVNLRNSNIKDLGDLEHVGGKLNLRDTKIKNLGRLKYVGNDLFLPEHLESLDISKIEVKGRVRYWKSNPNLTDRDYKLTNTQTKKDEQILGCHVRLQERPWRKPNAETVSIQDDYYSRIKSKIISENSNLDYYEDDWNLKVLHNRMLCESIIDLIKQKIEIIDFLSHLNLINNKFSKFSIPKFEFKILFEMCGLTQNIDFEMMNHLSYSQIHQLEIERKMRFFRARRIISNVAYLNDFIQRNIDEYYEFIDNKLGELYGNKYSLFESIFGDLKSVDEINREFPDKFEYSNTDITDKQKLIELRKDGLEYLKSHQQYPPFKKYSDALTKFETPEVHETKKRLWNRGELWLSYDENPLSYTLNDPNGNEFCYYVNNTLYQIFNCLCHDIFSSYINVNKFYKLC